MTDRQPRFEQLTTTRLVGISRVMTRAQDQTAALWQAFMPRRSSILRRTTTDYLSMQVYTNGPEQVADPEAEFNKWAAVQVEDFDSVPQGMQAYTLNGGLYAVFEHHGPATDLGTVMYIFRDWLPGSDYVLDDREHFEVLPDNYQPLDPEAHEEFWIPIRQKQAFA